MREKLLFNYGWKFHRKDITEEIPVTKNMTYWRTKTGSSTTVPSASFDTHNWVDVTLPHDYVIEDTPDPKKDNAIGYLRGETSWYRKEFILDESDRDKKLTLYFEGIAIESEIYLNGVLLARNHSAYTPIEVDITDTALFGTRKNVLAVHCIIPTIPEGWWYQGGGIYRDVYLVKTDKLCVDTWGVYVNPVKCENGGWDVNIETTLRNDSKTARNAHIVHEAVGKDGKVLFTAECDAEVSTFGKVAVNSSTSVCNPLIWDIDSPNLYTLVTSVYEDGELCDEYKVRFGFREFRFDADHGFFLNGRNIKLKGVCCHGDYGLTGIVLPKSVARYRLELLREMGANSYRSAHNMADEATMDACDELGILVFAETRYFNSSPECIEQLEMLVKRDRSRPSVICWSVGNEEPHQNTETGMRLAARMSAAVKKLDTTRPTTLVCCDVPKELEDISAPTARRSVDIISYNYSLALHDDLHKIYPDKPFVITETCALQTTRTHYFDDDYSKGYFSAYDHVMSRSDFNNCTRSETWAHIAERDYIAGGFVWAGIEHRGETVWPRLCSQSGLLDLYLQKKDAYYQTMAQYSEKPMIHLVPGSWNFEGLDGKEIRVVTYTNCDESEVFLNGRSLGRKATPEHFENSEWSVPYEKGTLTAVAYRDGKEIARDEVVTSGKAAALKIVCDTPNVSLGDTVLFTCYCVDSEGRFVPDASPLVSFTAEGCTLMGTGSDISDHVPPKCSDRRMRMGLISIAVCADRGKKHIGLVAEADGLAKAYIDIVLN